MKKFSLALLAMATALAIAPAAMADTPLGVTYSHPGTVTLHRRVPYYQLVHLTSRDSNTTPPCRFGACLTETAPCTSNISRCR